MKYKPNYRYIPPITWPILTPLYDFFCSVIRLGQGFRGKVLNTVQLRGGMTVVDIGCGTGVFLKVAKQKYPDIKFIGLDPDRQALAIAERRFARAQLSVELVEAFAESLPLADQSIDVCFSTLAFHHMPDDVKRRAIEEIHRVLKNGGIAVIADFGEAKGRFFWKTLFFEKLEYLEGNLNGLLPRFLRDVGFRNVRVGGHHFPGIDIVVAEKS